MQRRDFLKAAPAFASGAALAGLATGRAWAAPTGVDSRFLLVFLRGGYDALNLLVPAGSSGAYYREVRPTIAVPVGDGRPGAVAAVASAQASVPEAGASAPTAKPLASALDADWALHPALQASVLPLAQAGQAVFVPFAGTDDITRSHFETQDRIELGHGAQDSGAARDFSSGFLNRLALQLGVPTGASPTAVSAAMAASAASGAGAGSALPRAISFTDQLPICLRGRAQVANASLRRAPRAGRDAMQDSLAAMYRGTPLQAKVDEAFSVRQEVAQEFARENMASEMQAASRGAITTRGFELEAQRMARLMRGRYTLGFIDVGGWDTHVNEGGATGNLAQRLEELGRGLRAFADGLGDAAWRRTVVVVVSEFGRTVRENGSRGTDHGHGSVYWVLGGGLAAGAPVRGEQRAVAAGQLFQNRDLPVLNDYRGLLGGVFARQFGLSDAAVASVFPGVRPQDLRLL